MRHEVASKPACPKCGSTDIRRSRGEGLIALLARIFSRWPYRCRSCRVKFYRYSTLPHEHEHD
ncbi:MAG TPA: hypothetical protein VKX39_11385 [Bryobacteraceae bacterium]|nr:hypothetical protein [Bryobacteraceae bacterium]